MYVYQLNQEYFAQIADDIVKLGCDELLALGAESVRPAYRGLHFNATREAMYRINYESRLITRVIAPLVVFTCRNADHLYRKVLDIEWRDFFSVDHTFSVFASVSNNPLFRHSEFAALRVKDAIADYFRNLGGRRPSVEKINPDIWINVHIDGQQAVIGIDTSGGSLHRRGYRKMGVKAPIQETLAAAIIRLSQWNGERPLYDPTCGSGTFAAEALMHYCRIPAGILRKRFGFEFLPDYDRRIWKKIKETADRQIRRLPDGLIGASDISEEAVTATKSNLRMLPQGDRIAVNLKDFREISCLENHLIVSNPPYGIRLDDPAELELWYRDFGDFLKQRCTGSQVFVYVGNRDLIPFIGLKPSLKMPLKNGGLDGRLLKYNIFSGSDFLNTLPQENIT